MISYTKLISPLLFFILTTAHLTSRTQSYHTPPALEIQQFEVTSSSRGHWLMIDVLAFEDIDTHIMLRLPSHVWSESDKQEFRVKRSLKKGKHFRHRIRLRKESNKYGLIKLFISIENPGPYQKTYSEAIRLIPGDNLKDFRGRRYRDDDRVDSVAVHPITIDNGFFLVDSLGKPDSQPINAFGNQVNIKVSGKVQHNIGSPDDPNLIGTYGTRVELFFSTFVQSSCTL